MSGGSSYPITLTIKALDKATGPLRSINAAIEKATHPTKTAFKNFKDQFGKGTGLGDLFEKFKHVGEAAKEMGLKVFEAGKKILEFAGIAGAIGLVELVHHSIEAGAQLAHVSKRVGLTADAFAQYQYAAKQSGVDTESFASAMDTFNKNLGQAHLGAGRFYKLLTRASPVFASQIKHAKTTEEALRLVVKAFELHKNAADRAALAVAGFGDPKIVEFLSKGTEEIGAFRKEHEKLVGPQNEFAKQSLEAEEALNKLNLATEGTKNRIALALYPALEKLSIALTKFLTDNQPAIEKWATSVGTAMAAWITNGGLERLSTNLGEVAHAIGVVVDTLGPKGLAGAFLLIQFGPVIQGVLSLTAATFGLGAAMLPITLAIVGVGAAVYELKTHWEDLKAVFKDFEAMPFARLVFEGMLNPAAAAAHLASGTFFKGDEDRFTRSALTGGTGGTGPMRFANPASLLKPTHPSAAHTVNVNFDNLPRGARVSTESTGGGLNLSTGYNMSGE